MAGDTDGNRASARGFNVRVRSDPLFVVDGVITDTQEVPGTK